MKLQLKQPLSKGTLIFFFVVAALGFLDAAYLTVEHYLNSVPPCAIGGCEVVLTSVYATVAGVPVALLGALYYLVVLVLLKMYLDTKKEIFARIALLLTIAGMLSTIYFFILQAFVLHAFCVYCIGSAITSTALFIGALVVWKKDKAIIAQ